MGFGGVHQRGPGARCDRQLQCRRFSSLYPKYKGDRLRKFTPASPASADHRFKEPPHARYEVGKATAKAPQGATQTQV